MYGMADKERPSLLSPEPGHCYPGLGLRESRAVSSRPPSSSASQTYAFRRFFLSFVSLAIEFLMRPCSPLPGRPIRPMLKDGDGARRLLFGADTICLSNKVSEDSPPSFGLTLQFSFVVLFVVRLLA